MTAAKKKARPAKAAPAHPAPARAVRTVYDFLQEHGRLPKLGDPEPPWTFKGWALPYVQQIHALHPDVPDRWGYLLRTLEAGHLLDEPIPPIHFGPTNQQVAGMLDRWTGTVGWDMGGWSDFRVLVEWLGWSLGVLGECPDLKDATHEKLYRDVNLVPLLESPRDYLGMWVSERKAAGWNPSGFYPTPHEVCELMIAMTMHDYGEEGRDARTASVCDPCVGTGRMLLHASNLSLNLYGQDIDHLVCSICKINGALYAPWIVCPLGEEILGRPVPARPPAPLPVPEDRQPPEGVPVYRADDLGQLLLFHPSED
jgi:hypothetical protein